MKKLVISLLVLGCAFSVFADNYPVPPSTDKITYIDEQFRTQDGLVLHGHLAIPAGQKGPFPVVLMLVGSGSSDRYENIVGGTVDGKPALLFKGIEDGLIAKDIAVFMYDKRGVIPLDNTFYYSTRTADFQTANANNLANDAVSAFDFTKQIPLVDPRRIAIFGHSEGTFLAIKTMEKRTDQVRSLFLLGMITSTPKEIFHAQFTTDNVRIFNLVNAGQTGTLTQEEYDNFAAQAGPVFTEIYGTWQSFYNANSQLARPGQITEQEFNYTNKQIWKQLVEAAYDDSKPWKMTEPRAWLREYLAEGSYLPREMPFCSKIHVFQGEVDQDTPFEDALTLRNSCNAAHTPLASFNNYPNLEHALSPYIGYKNWQDTMGPMDPQGTADIVNAITKDLLQ